MAFILRKLVGLWRFLLQRRLMTLRLVPPLAQSELVPVAIESEPEPKSESVLGIPAEATTLVESQAEPIVYARRSLKRELETTWHFRSTILDRLDEFFVCVRRVQKHDPESYRLLSRTGLTIPADAYCNPDHQDTLSAVRESQVSFGGMLVTAVEDDDRDHQISASFVYFHKLKRPSRVQSFRGAVYALTAVYDDRVIAKHWRSNFTVPETCYIGVTPEGAMHLLKQPIEVSSRIQPRAGKLKRGKQEAFNLRTRHWQYPLWVREVCSDKDKDPNVWATGLLAMALVTYAQCISKIVIRAKRDGCVAAFGIDVKRGKYFFADREAELATDGRKKRIFHSVIAHDRQIGQNRTTRVRDHYRGLRDFNWNGYGIHIVWPKHSGVLKFDKPAQYEEDVAVSVRSKMVNGQRAGEMLADVLES